MRYALPASSGLVGDEATIALDQSLTLLRKRAEYLDLTSALVSRSGSEITVDIPGGNELSVAELRSILPLRGLFGLHLVRHEGPFMTDLCASLADDSMAGVMRIETGLDLWQGPGGATLRQCYLVANNRVAMLNAQEAAAEGCAARGNAERTRCIVSGRTMLRRYLATRNDIEPEPGYRLAFASDESSGSRGSIGERYWRSYYLQSEASVDNSMIESLVVQDGTELETYVLRIGLNSQGQEQLRELTENHVGHKLGIVIDGRVESAPTIIETISGGSLAFSLAPSSPPAKTVAASLRTGPLPAALEEVAATSYSHANRPAKVAGRPE